MGIFNHIHIYFTIYSTKSHVINYKTKWRLIQGFITIYFKDQHICLSIKHIWCNVYRKCSISAGMGIYFLPIDIHGGLMARSFTSKEHRFFFPRFLYTKGTTIGTYHLIIIFIKIVIWQLLAGVWKTHIHHLTVTKPWIK